MRKVRHYDFFGRRRLFYAVSMVLIVAGLVFLALPGFGLRLGIDFVGGSLLEARFERADVSTAEVRDALTPLGYGEPIIQRAADDPHRFLIRTRVFGDEERVAVQQALIGAVGPFAVERFEGIAGVIGAEMTRRSLLAVAVAAGLMLLYITIRFEFRFGVAAIVALLHDVLITVAAFSVLQREVNSSFVAAVLTVVGYSINDTIVVFDRIRENLRARLYGRGETARLVNSSIAETLSRSINTSLTTLLAIGAVLVFGGRTTRDFALALMIGMAAGTYSSIFIASPIWGTWRERDLARAGGGAAGPDADSRPARLSVDQAPPGAKDEAPGPVSERSPDSSQGARPQRTPGAIPGGRKPAKRQGGKKRRR